MPRGAASGRRGAKQPPPTQGQRVRRWLRRRRGWFASAGVLAAVVGLVVYLSNPFATYTAVDASGKTVRTGVIPVAGAAPRVYQPAPDFLLADYNGNAVRLDEFHGKTVLLNFWASWCTTCEAEMPDMDRLAKEHPADLVVLAVNQAEGRGTARSFSDALGLTYMRFALDKNKDVTNAYQLPSGLPHSFFIDKDGIVRAVKHGGMTYDEMAQLLRQTQAAANRAG